MDATRTTGLRIVGITGVMTREERLFLNNEVQDRNNLRDPSNEALNTSFNRNVLQSAWAYVLGARTNQPVVFVLFEYVRGPS